MTLERYRDTARQLANDLFSSEEARCKEETSCIRRESERPLTTKEKRDGWAMRPFWAYEAERMCRSCAAYWHVELAEQLLYEAHCWQQIIEREQVNLTRKGVGEGVGE